MNSLEGKMPVASVRGRFSWRGKLEFLEKTLESGRGGLKLSPRAIHEGRTTNNLVPRSHSVTGNVRSGKVRQYTIFHWPLKKGCRNAIYAPIGLFRGHVMKVWFSQAHVLF